MQKALQGNISIALRLFRTGRKLMYDTRSRLAVARSWNCSQALYEELKSPFDRLDFQAAMVRQFRYRGMDASLLPAC